MRFLPLLSTPSEMPDLGGDLMDWRIFFGSPYNSKEEKGAEDLLILSQGLFQVFKCPNPPTLMFSAQTHRAASVSFHCSD